MNMVYRCTQKKEKYFDNDDDKDDYIKEYIREQVTIINYTETQRWNSDDKKKLAGLEPKYTRIKIHKLAHDDKGYSSIYVSLDLGRITRRKQKRKYQKLQSQGIK